MATAVARRVEKTVQKTVAPQRAKSPRVHTKRHIKAKASIAWWLLLVAFCLVAPFAYTDLYADLKTTSYSCSDYQSMYWQAKVDNERLQVQVVRYSSPGRIKAAATRLGMVPAKDYDYLDQAQTVASR